MPYNFEGLTDRAILTSPSSLPRCPSSQFIYYMLGLYQRYLVLFLHPMTSIGFFLHVTHQMHTYLVSGVSQQPPNLSNSSHTNQTPKDMKKYTDTVKCLHHDDPNNMVSKLMTMLVFSLLHKNTISPLLFLITARQRFSPPPLYRSIINSPPPSPTSLFRCLFIRFLSLKP